MFDDRITKSYVAIFFNRTTSPTLYVFNKNV